MKNKRNNYGNIYNFANKNKKMIAGIIGGIGLCLTIHHRSVTLPDLG